MRNRSDTSTADEASASARASVRIRTAADLRGAKVEPLFRPARLLKAGVIEADAYVLAKRAEADALLDAARADADAVRAAAHQEAVDEYAKLAQPLFESLARAIDANVNDLAQTTQRLALEIARHVLSAELTLRPDHLLSILIDVLSATHRYDDLILRVHPDDHPLVAAQMEKLKDALTPARSLQLVADSAIERHSVRIDTEMGRYEDGVRQRLDQLSTLLTNADRASGGHA